MLIAGLFRRIAEVVVVGFGALALSACVTTGDPTTRYVGVVDTGWSEIPVERARVGIPSSHGFSALEARELRHPEGELLQEVVFSNASYLPGENRITIAVDFKRGTFAGYRDGTVGEYDFDEDFIRRQAVQQFSGAQQVGTPSARQSALGLFYFISAEYRDGRCVYAWQVVEGDRLRKDVKRASIQLRACDQTKSVQDLLQVFANLRLAV